MYENLKSLESEVSFPHTREMVYQSQWRIQGVPGATNTGIPPCENIPIRYTLACHTTREMTVVAMQDLSQNQNINNLFILSVYRYSEKSI